MEQVITIYGLVSMDSKQGKEIEKHCYGDCGKISIAGVIDGGPLGALSICNEKVCPYMGHEVPEYGTSNSFGRPHSVTLRLLNVEMDK